MPARPFSPWFHRTLLHRKGENPFDRDFLITAGSNLVAAAATAFSGIIAARLLGPDGRGQLAAALVWAAILGMIAQVGLPQALTYYTARDVRSISSVFSNAVFLLVVQSAVIMPIGFFAVSLVLGRYQPDAVHGVSIYLLSIPFSLLTIYLGAMAQGLRRFKLFAVMRLVSPVTYAMGLILAGSLGLRTPDDLIKLLVTVQAGAAAVSALIFVQRARPKSSRIERVHISRMLRYGTKAYVGNLSWLANGRIDQLIMSAFVSLDNLGFYAVAVSYATILVPISSAFGMVLFPRTASDDPAMAEHRIYRLLRTNLIVSGIGALVLILLSPILVTLLFGAVYEESIVPAIILTVGTILLGCNYILSDGLRGLGHPGIPSVAELIALGATLIGLFLLLPRLGIVGAAWVSTLSYSLTFLVLWIGLRNVFAIRANT